MCDWIKWGEIESAEMSHHDAFYIIITVSIFMFLSLIIIDAQNAASYFGLAIGLFGILIAAHSIQSSTRQLIEMEVDYWNARGIDHNNKGAELRKKSEYDQAAWAYEDAIEAFDKASKLDPLSAKNWSNRGNALVDRGKYDEAIKAFIHALELDSLSAKTWNNYGRALHAKGDALRDHDDFKAMDIYAAAINAFDRAIEQDFGAIRAWNNKGGILKSQGDIFKKRGDLLYAQSKYDAAIRAYDKAIELDQNFAGFWYNKGIAIDARGYYDEAIEVLT